MGAETSGADLLVAPEHARAMESLKKIYTLVSKDGRRDGEMENGWNMDGTCWFMMEDMDFKPRI